VVAMLKDVNPQLQITASGLHQRINQSGVEYLKEMFSQALELSAIKLIDESVPKLLEHFEKVHLISHKHPYQKNYLKYGKVVVEIVQNQL
jgi:hypothetical protein